MRMSGAIRALSGIIAIVFSVLLMAGCSLGPASMGKPQQHPPDRIPDQMRKETDALSSLQQRAREELQKKGTEKPEPQPLIPVYDPLEDQIVSFSLAGEDLQMVLYALSQTVGVNFIVDPEVSNEQRKLTLKFENVSAASVLREILAAYDLTYRTDGNIIRITPWQEQVFKLNFLDSLVESRFDIGGDVLGAGATETTKGLSGNFKITGFGSQNKSAYEILENMIKPMLSTNGKFAINRLSGSLYVKDRPNVVRSVGQVVQHYKRMLARQILIEARIIEVTLTDAYRYGIDWSALRSLNDATSEITGAAWSLGNGLVLSGTSGEWALNAAVDALRTFGDSKVVSNPTVRSKHGQPAVISVGTSYTYKKSIETTRFTTGTTDDTTTNVEVSTVFDGLILGVVPFIDENGQITLLINPIKSDVDQASLDDEFISDGLSISLPRVSIKELISTIALNNGDIVILGGLIDKRKVTENKGVPFLSSLPLLGYLFKNEDQRDETRELVIILSVHTV